MMSSLSPLSQEDRQFFSDFGSTPAKFLPKGPKVSCLVHFTAGDQISVESDNLFRRTWICLSGAQKEYSLETNIGVLADKIQNGLRMGVEGRLSEGAKGDVAESYGKYQMLVKGYARRHTTKDFSAEIFKKVYEFRPLQAFWGTAELQLQERAENGNEPEKALARQALSLIHCFEDTHNPVAVRLNPGRFWSEAKRIQSLLTTISAFSCPLCPPELDSWLKKAYADLNPEEARLKEEWENRIIDLVDIDPPGLCTSTPEMEQRIRLFLNEFRERIVAKSPFERWAKNERSEGKDLFVRQVRFCVGKMLLDPLKINLIPSFLEGAMKCGRFPDHNVEKRLSDLEKGCENPRVSRYWEQDLRRHFGQVWIFLNDPNNSEHCPSCEKDPCKLYCAGIPADPHELQARLESVTATMHESLLEVEKRLGQGR